MAQQPQQQRSAAPPPGANATLSTSAAGRAALAAREGQGGRPGNQGGAYDDSATNCTVGIGTLVHYGPCTPEELSRPADPAQNQADFDARVRTAEAAVRANVNARTLNQNQYDALVSGAYNSGRGMAQVYTHANNGDDVGAMDQMRKNVLIHRHDAQGHSVGPAIVSQGLVNRRAGEIAQYNRPVAPAAGTRR